MYVRHNAGRSKLLTEFATSTIERQRAAVVQLQTRVSRHVRIVGRHASNLIVGIADIFAEHGAIGVALAATGPLALFLLFYHVVSMFF